MYYLDRDEVADKENKRMKRIMNAVLNEKKYDENNILQLIGKQKDELSLNSSYYAGNISEGNWSLLKKDEDIKTLDEKRKDEIVDALDIMLGLDTYEKDSKLRNHDAEYEYVFKPSFYAVFSLIFYYINHKRKAGKVYNLKTAVLRKNNKKVDEYYGGLPFVLKYLNEILDRDPGDSILSEFTEILDKLAEREYALEMNNEYDEFLNDIINCMEKSGCKDFILKKRVKDFEYSKDKYFHIEYKVDDYDILYHRDVKKDWKFLEDAYLKEANEKVRKTPKHPFNDSEKDSEKLTKNLKGWFSQRIGKKDRLVYKKDAKNKVVYIATVCDHYKDAPGRTKKLTAYR